MADTPTTYGVWIDGKGWLKGPAKDGRADVFASTDQAIAETAAALYGAGAAVWPMDLSLVDFEPLFLERRAALATPKGWWQWLTFKK